MLMAWDMALSEAVYKDSQTIWQTIQVPFCKESSSNFLYDDMQRDCETSLQSHKSRALIRWSLSSWKYVHFPLQNIWLSPIEYSRCKYVTLVSDQIYFVWWCITVSYHEVLLSSHVLNSVHLLWLKWLMLLECVVHTSWKGMAHID